MDELSINSENGIYSIILREIKYKKIAYLDIKEVKDLNKLIIEAKKILEPYMPKEILFRTKEKCFLPSYLTMEEYVFSFNHFKSDKNYKLVPLAVDNRNGFAELSNKIYERNDITFTFEERDIIDLIRNNVNVGYITFKKAIVGIYEIKDDLIEKIGIDPSFQGLDHGINGLKKITNAIGKDARCIIASNNTKAVQMVLNLGFIHKKTESSWYKVSSM